jgi:hypothetical protein
MYGSLRIWVGNIVCSGACRFEQIKGPGTLIADADQRHIRMMMDLPRRQFAAKTETIEKLRRDGLGYAVWTFGLDAAYSVQNLGATAFSNIENLLRGSLSKSIVSGPPGRPFLTSKISGCQHHPTLTYFGRA